MIYLDNHNATPPEAQVLEAMRMVWERGNAPIDAQYPWGRANKQAVEQAREKVEATLHASSTGHVAFTRGNAHAHRELFEQLYRKRIEQEGKRGIVLSCREDATVMDEALRLKRRGVEVRFVPLDANGAVDATAFAQAIDGETAWASIVSVDAQSGVIMPVDELASVCKLHGVPLHTDATYAIGKLPFDTETIEADFVTFEGRTLFVPGNIGALFVRNEARAWFDAASFERQTPYADAASAVALGKGCELVSDMMDFERAEIKELRDDLEEALRDIDGVWVLTPANVRIPHTVAFAVEGVASESAQRLLSKEGWMLLSGADHQRRNPYQTPLIDALGLPKSLRHTVLSVTLSHRHTDEDIEALASVIKKTILPLRYAA